MHTGAGRRVAIGQDRPQAGTADAQGEVGGAIDHLGALVVVFVAVDIELHPILFKQGR